MPASRKHRKHARWSAETRQREAPLDEVPDKAIRRLSIPYEDMPSSQRPVDAETAELAVRMQIVRRQIRRARWVPWRRRKRPLMQTELEELARRRRALRGSETAGTRL